MSNEILFARGKISYLPSQSRHSRAFPTTTGSLSSHDWLISCSTLTFPYGQANAFSSRFRFTLSSLPSPPRKSANGRYSSAMAKVSLQLNYLGRKGFCEPISPLFAPSHRNETRTTCYRDDSQSDHHQLLTTDLS